jgi:Dockerin type I domain
VSDVSGNMSKIKQAIYVRKSELSAVVCPPAYVVQCGGNGINLSPDSVQLNGVWVAGTGKPTFPNGVSITNSLCKIGTSYTDLARTSTTTGYYFVRNWTFGNVCTSEITSCQQLITVSDNAPTLTCKTNYAVTLSAITSTAKVTALAAINTLTDECTPLSNLMVRIQRLTNGMPWPDSTEVTFNCNDIGSSLVEVLAKDPSGFMAKCQATVQVTDPNTVCRAPVQPAILGLIETEEGKPVVANVELLNNANSTIRLLTRASKFSFLGITRGEAFDVTPTRDSDYVNGVTTFDVALMSRHILDVQPLTSPLKQIAGDVNGDGSIDAIDMIITRRLVLRIIEIFPGNKSWRFVPKVFPFPVVAKNVPATSFPESLTFINVTDTIRTADFWAIKTGDLNGSANANALRGDAQTQLRGSGNPLIVKANDVYLEKDKTYDIDISSEKMDANGFQFTLNFDKEALKIMSFEQGELPNFNHTNYALFPSEGKATVSWNGSSDSKTSPMNIFRLRLLAKQSGRLSNALHLTSDLTPAEAFSLAGDTRSVALEFNGAQNNDFALFQNAPNPSIAGSTNIRFRLPEASETRLTFYDVSGKMLKTETRRFEKGDNNWRITTPSVSGLVLYRLETPTHSATRRMVIGE